jgi:hypothetical protein
VWGQDQVSIYLCAWHILKVWKFNWCLHSMEIIKDNGVPCAIYIRQPSHHHVYAHWTRWKHSWLVGETRSLKASPNIYLVIHGFNIFGPIISNMVHELTLNPLLVFHHVMHIPKYSLFELRYKHQWSKQSHGGIVYFVVYLWMVGLW